MISATCGTPIRICSTLCAPTSTLASPAVYNAHWAKRHLATCALRLVRSRASEPRLAARGSHGGVLLCFFWHCMPNCNTCGRHSASNLHSCMLVSGHGPCRCQCVLLRPCVCKMAAIELSRAAAWPASVCWASGRVGSLFGTPLYFGGRKP